jgi:hypothetical protein
VTVAVADLNRDGFADVIVGRASLGPPTVNVYSGNGLGLVRSFNAFSPTFLGGVTVAAGDVNGDGIPDVIVGAGPGGLARVVVYSGADVFAGRPLVPLSKYLAASNLFRGGVIVTTQTLRGGNPGFADLVQVATVLGQIEGLGRLFV